MKYCRQDYEHVRQTMATRGYQILEERWRKLYDGKLRELAQPLDQQATDQARGFLAAIDMCRRAAGFLRLEVERAERSKSRR